MGLLFQLRLLLEKKKHHTTRPTKVFLKCTCPHQLINQMFHSVTHLIDKLFFPEATVSGRLSGIKLPSVVPCEEISPIIHAILLVNPHYLQSVI